MSRLLDDYASIVARKAKGALDATALRTRSSSMLDLLAYLSTHRRLTFDAVRRCLHEAQQVPWRASLSGLEPLDPKWTARLARVLALQTRAPSDRRDALALLRYVAQVHGSSVLDGRHAELFAQLLFLSGEVEDLERHLPELTLSEPQRAALHADRANPFLSGSSVLSVPGWLRRLERLMGFSREPTMVLTDDVGETPFERLASAPRRQIQSGPLVTVIVPTYCPDDGLVTAVRSLVHQSWEPLEILVVDDGSPMQYRDLLLRVADFDERVRLIRRDMNGGAYRARNTGIAAATGDFFTVQDSDDWSHPNRIEFQLEPLLQDPAIIATRSRAVRTTSNLLITQLGYGPLHDNASSLLVRAEPVRSDLGYFDTVRKGADTEYYLRVLARYGDHAVADIREPALAIIRRTQGSLSRSEFGPGWKHPARAEYRQSYTWWHAAVRGGRSAFLANDQHPRPFPAPRSFLDRPDRLDQQRFDAVLLGDWRAFGGPQASMIEEIRALSGRGLRIGVAHLEALRFMTRRDDPLCSPVRQLLADGVVERVLPYEDTAIDLLIVRYPPILQFPPSDPTHWRVNHCWLVANQAPSERDGSDLRYLAHDCTRSAEQLFRRPPLWVPQGPTVRRALETTLTPSELATFDSPGILDPNEWFRPRRPQEHTRARVGRYSRDTAMKFPATGADLRSIYDDDRLNITMMGATKRVPELLGQDPIPANWTLLQQGAVPVKSFLQDIDFFVYFDHPTSREAFGRSVLEAIASGCLVVLPHHFRSVFGEAAVYSSPSSASDTVARYHARPEAYQAQVASARRIIKERFSHDAFVRLVSPNLTKLATAQPRPRTPDGGGSQRQRLNEVTKGQ